MQTIVTARELQGIGSIPATRAGAIRWLKRVLDHCQVVKSVGGHSIAVNLSDLPEPERRAYLEAQAEASVLPAGTYDDATHSEYLNAPLSMRHEAERKAKIARVLAELGSSIKWSDREAVLRSSFGPKLPSRVTLKRILSTVKNVDPINYAPALLPGYKPKKATAKVTDKAWSMFLAIVRDAGRDFPLSYRAKMSWAIYLNLKAGHSHSQTARNVNCNILVVRKHRKKLELLGVLETHPSNPNGLSK